VAIRGDPFPALVGEGGGENEGGCAIGASQCTLSSAWNPHDSIVPYSSVDGATSLMWFTMDVLLVKRGPPHFLLWLHQAVRSCVGG